MPTRRLLSLLAASALTCSAACSSAGSDAPPTKAAGATTPEGACVAVASASEPVRITNDFGSMEGSLTVPDGCGPLPVVLILSGSGSTDRDGNVPGDTKKPAIYRVLAEALAKAGIASLRYDDEGIGGSTTGAPDKVEDFRFAMEIADAARFIAKLRDDARLGPVVVAGHSQGSLTGIMAAKTQPIDGFISLAGAGRPVGQLLREQLAKRLTSAQAAALDAAVTEMEHGRAPGPLAAPLDQILPASEQPYMMSWMAVDPKAEIAALAAPTLLLQGKLDTQVQVLDATLLDDGKPDATLTLVDDMGHMLRRVTSKDAAAQKASYSEPLPIHETVVEAIASFVRALPRPSR